MAEDEVTPERVIKFTLSRGTNLIEFGAWGKDGDEAKALFDHGIEEMKKLGLEWFKK